MYSRDLHDLHPQMEPLARAMMARAEMLDVHPLVACTYRDNAEQDMLWTYGRSMPSPVGPWSPARPLGAIVTRARGGHSAHNYAVDGIPMALALDVYPTIGGKLVTAKNSPLWQALGRCGIEVGLEWYGSPGSDFVEFPHFALPIWHDLMFPMAQVA